METSMSPIHSANRRRRRHLDTPSEEDVVKTRVTSADSSHSISPENGNGDSPPAINRIIPSLSLKVQQQNEPPVLMMTTPRGSRRPSPIVAMSNSNTSSYSNDLLLTPRPLSADDPDLDSLDFAGDQIHLTSLSVSDDVPVLTSSVLLMENGDSLKCASVGHTKNQSLTSSAASRRRLLQSLFNQSQYSNQSQDDRSPVLKSKASKIEPPLNESLLFDDTYDVSGAHDPQNDRRDRHGNTHSNLWSGDNETSKNESGHSHGEVSESKHFVQSSSNHQQDESSPADPERVRRPIERIGDQRIWTDWHTSIHQTRLDDGMTTPIRGSMTTPNKSMNSPLRLGSSFVQPRENRTSELRRLKTALTTTCRTNEIPQGRPVIPEISQLLKSLPMSNFGIKPDSLKLLDDNHGSNKDMNRHENRPLSARLATRTGDQFHDWTTRSDAGFLSDTKSRSSRISDADSTAKVFAPGRSKRDKESAVKKSFTGDSPNFGAPVVSPRLLADLERARRASRENHSPSRVQDGRRNIWRSGTASSAYLSKTRTSQALRHSSGQSHIDNSSPLRGNSRLDSSHALGHVLGPSPNNSISGQRHPTPIHQRPEYQQAGTRGSSMGSSSVMSRTRLSSPQSRTPPAAQPPAFLLEQLRASSKRFSKHSPPNAKTRHLPTNHRTLSCDIDAASQRPQSLDNFKRLISANLTESSTPRSMLHRTNATSRPGMVNSQNAANGIRATGLQRQARQVENHAVPSFGLDALSGQQGDLRRALTDRRQHPSSANDSYQKKAKKFISDDDGPLIMDVPSLIGSRLQQTDQRRQVSLPWSSTSPSHSPSTARQHGFTGKADMRVKSFPRSPTRSAHPSDLNNGIAAVLARVSSHNRSPSANTTASTRRTPSEDISRHHDYDQYQSKQQEQETLKGLHDKSQTSSFEQSLQQQFSFSEQERVRQQSNMPPHLFELLDLLEENVVNKESGSLQGDDDFAVQLIVQLRRRLLMSQQSSSLENSPISKSRRRHIKQNDFSPPIPQLCFKFTPMELPLLSNYPDHHPSKSSRKKSIDHGASTPCLTEVKKAQDENSPGSTHEDPSDAVPLEKC